MARAKRARHPLHVVRIAVQLAFFLLFLALLVLTARGTWVTARPYLAQVFLITDPLVLAGAALAGAFSAVLLAALAVVALSLVAPRAYCGWICPLGTTMDIVDKLLFRKRERSRYQTPRLRQAKYAVLVLVLVLAPFGLGIFGWLDPVALATRSYGVAVLPMADHAAKKALVAAEEAGAPGAAKFYDWARSSGLLAQDADLKEDAKWLAFRQGWLLLALLAAIVLAQAYQKRFWCRNLCPLGALLGLIGSASPWRPRVSAACVACDRCRARCKTGAFEPGEGESAYRCLVQECTFCWACERDFCPVDAIHVGAGLPRLRPGPGVLPSRRAFFGTAAAGAVVGSALLLDRRTRAKEESGRMLRPPGALQPDDDFLAACIRCGACMKVCPTNALHPAGVADGVAGLWAPTFVFNIGYCDYYCGVRRGDVEAGAAADAASAEADAAAERGRGSPPAADCAANLCGTVCPTGAIARLSQAEKTEWRIGTAGFDKNRCLPWARGEACLTCEEQCPLPEKAISHQTVEVANRAWLELSQPARNRYESLEAKRAREGLSPEEAAELAALPSKTVPLALPYVLADRCIGCGTCENVCPVEGPSGIRVGRVQPGAAAKSPAGCGTAGSSSRAQRARDPHGRASRPCHTPREGRGRRGG